MWKKNLSYYLKLDRKNLLTGRIKEKVFLIAISLKGILNC